jgi:hypothetical protein
VRDDVALEYIAPSDWDALAPAQPLLSHAFLRALHETGCATRATGWQPRYLTAWQGDSLVGAMPLYAKSHSYGEYVFDWSWADAYRRYGHSYYPKLVAAIPFTPVTGPRLLGTAAARRALLTRALDTLEAGQYSSLHVLFPDDDDAELGRRAGMIERTGAQFHWDNAAYRDFEDFLAALSHDKRKKIRQERRKLAGAGATFERKTGDAITDDDWTFFVRCYEETYRAHQSTPYLSLDFFRRIGTAMPGNLLLVIGRRGGERICAALDVYSAGTLWGRYWGAVAHVPGAHFEACYYQAIEFCIERGIQRFEGGAQGSHKLARGLLPATTRSLHAIADPSFADAIARYCQQERADVAHAVSELEASSPYRESPPEAGAC